MVVTRTCAVKQCSSACRTYPTSRTGTPQFDGCLRASPVDAHDATASQTSARAATRSNLRAVRALLV
jgi:hypothetical protein